MASESEWPEIPSRRLAALVVLGVIIAALAFVLNWWIETLTAWWLYAGVFPLPTILWLLLFNVLLARVSSSLRLSKQEFVFLIAVSYLVSGWYYLPFGCYRWNVASVPTYHLFLPIYVLKQDYGSQIAKYIPSWMAPTDTKVLDMIWRGLRPGESIDWGAWIAPIAFWTIMYLIWTLSAPFFGFMVRKTLIEVERLPFPDAIPTANLINWAYGSEEKPKLFDLKSSIGKYFWIGFVIGFLSTFIDVIHFFIPAIPPSAEWSDRVIKIGDFMARFLPGAAGYWIFVIPEVPLFYLMRNDTLLTLWVTAIFFNIIVNHLYVRFGLVSYEPGIENFEWWTPIYYGWKGPFKFSLFAAYGLGIGLGLMTLYTARDQIARIFRAAFSGEGGSEDGVSYRLVAWGSIGIFLAALVYFIAAGVPPVVALFILAVWVILWYGNIRVLSEVLEWDVVGMWFQPFWWDVGAAVGAWPAKYPAISESLVRTNMMGVALLNWGPRLSSQSWAYSFPLWKVAYETRTKAKYIFLAMVVVALTVAAIHGPLAIWWMHKLGGFEKLGPIVYHEWSEPQFKQYLVAPPDPETPPLEHWGYLIGGIVLTFIIYFLRSRFTWFFITPVGLMVGMIFPAFFLIGPILALILKVLTIRIGGTRLYEEVGVPLAVGFAFGYGLNYFFVCLLAFVTRAWPEFWARL